MTKRELVLTACQNKPTSRVPVGFWLHFTPNEMVDGLKHPEHIELSYDGHCEFFRESKPDLIKIMTDGFFNYPNDQFMFAKTVSDLEKVKPIGEDHPWIQKQVEFAKKLTDYFAGETATFYNMIAPIAAFKFTHNTPGEWVGNPQHTGEIVIADFITQDADVFAHAMKNVAQDYAALARRVISEGKVDGLYYCINDINDSRITKEIREKTLVPADHAIFEGANSAGNYNIVHICGFGERRNNLNNYVDYPAQIFNWAVHAENVSLGDGKKLFKNKPVIAGFLNSKDGVLFKGTKEEVEAETEALLRGAGTTTGVILGADCAIPRDVERQRFNWVRDKAASFKI